jgi:hypothetical protein
MAGGFHSTRPSWYSVALVASVTSKFPSALQADNRIQIWSKSKHYKFSVNSLGVYISGVGGVSKF